MTPANPWVVGAAIACLLLGDLLARRIEPGIRVTKVTLATNTPAIRLCHDGLGPYPIAVLAHGGTALKETLFRYGEALAVAGFDCYTVDLPGHGESRQSFTIPETIRVPAKLEQALGGIDVYLGHSMGAGAGFVSVRECGFRPKFFISLGNDMEMPTAGPPLLYLAGQFEEFFRPTQLKARTKAPVVISPWSDHLLEPYDPYLINAAVSAACASVGKAPPAAPLTAWRWRLAGLIFGFAGTVGLIFSLPEVHPRFSRVRGFIIPAVVIVGLVLTTGTWFGATPRLHRLPLQIILGVLMWVALLALAKFGKPRWSITVIAAIVTVCCVAAVFLFQPASFFYLLTIVLAISMVWLVAGTVLGWIAARGGSRRDGDIAMAIFVGYAIGQWIPKSF